MLQPYKSFVTVCAVASLLYAQTAPSLRNSSGTDLKVKPMLEILKMKIDIMKYCIQQFLLFFEKNGEKR